MPCQFQSIDFFMGNYLVQKGDLKGLYTTSGKEIMPCQYKNITMYRGEWLGKM